MTAPPLLSQPSFSHLEHDPAYLADPSPFFQILRERRVCFDREHGALVFSQFEDVRQALISRAFSTSLGQGAGQNASARASSGWRSANVGRQGVLPDGAHHLYMRAILREALSPSALRRLRIEQNIEQIGRLLLDRIVAGGAGSFDLIRDLSAPLSLHMLIALLGLPRDQVSLSRFACWMEALAPLSGETDQAPPSHWVARRLAEMQAFFQRLLSTEEARPGTLFGALIAAKHTGRMPLEESLLACWLMLAAGHRHTVSAVANCALALLSHPDQLRLVRDRPALIEQTVEEGLRYAPPVPWVERRACSEGEVAGVSFRAGQRVLLALAAANREQEPFDQRAPHPDLFDLWRVHGRHLSFGYGAHFCLGFRLARLQIATILHLMLARFPSLALAQGPQRRAATAIGLLGWPSLPIVYTHQACRRGISIGPPSVREALCSFPGNEEGEHVQSHP
jgi:cytochrome P450